MTKRATPNPTRQDDARWPISRRYELRWPGVLYFITTLFLAIGAFNSQNNLLYWVFGVAVTGVIVSGVISGAALMRITLRREAPEQAAVGAPLTIRYTVQNHARFVPAFALEIRERGDERNGSAPPRGLEDTAAIIDHAAPGRRAIGAVTLTPERRGETRLRYVTVSTVFPFGLVRKTLEFEAPARVIVCPRITPVQGALLRELRTESRLSEHATARTGDGSEFYGLRDYRPGDPLRMIAWRRSATRGSMVVRQHAAPASSSVWVVLDDALRPLASTDEDAFETAIEAAASFARALASQGRVVGVAAEWSGVLAPAASGAGSDRRAQAALALLTPEREPSSALPAERGRVVLTISTDAAGTTTIDGPDRSSWAAKSELQPELQLNDNAPPDSDDAPAPRPTPDPSEAAA